jgi:DNA-binding response OmpR family regulator
VRTAAEILVVDDDPCIRDLLKLHLSSAGHHVRAAEDALIAGRMLIQSPPDLLIVDVEMPYMNGLELVATMIADQTVPWIPVIFLTGKEGLEDRAEALGAAYLKKPCKTDDLLRLVTAQLASTKAEGYFSKLSSTSTEIGLRKWNSAPASLARCS